MGLLLSQRVPRTQGGKKGHDCAPRGCDASAGVWNEQEPVGLIENGIETALDKHPTRRQFLLRWEEKKKREWKRELTDKNRLNFFVNLLDLFSTTVEEKFGISTKKYDKPQNGYSILRSVESNVKKRGGGGGEGERKDTLSVRARVGSLSLVEQVARGHRAVRISLLKYNHPNQPPYRLLPPSLPRVSKPRSIFPEKCM